MKKIKYIFSIAIITLILTSCGSKYDFEHAEKLLEKIEEEDKLTNNDYLEMIELCEIGFSCAIDEYEAALDIKNKYDCRDALKEISNDDELNFIFGYSGQMYLTLEQAAEADELKSDTKKRFRELKKQHEKIIKLVGKIEKKIS